MPKHRNTRRKLVSGQLSQLLWLASYEAGCTESTEPPRHAVGCVGGWSQTRTCVRARPGLQVQVGGREELRGQARGRDGQVVLGQAHDQEEERRRQHLQRQRRAAAQAAQGPPAARLHTGRCRVYGPVLRAAWAAARLHTGQCRVYEPVLALCQSASQHPCNLQKPAPAAVQPRGCTACPRALSVASQLINYANFMNFLILSVNAPAAARSCAARHGTGAQALACTEPAKAQQGLMAVEKAWRDWYS